MRRTTPFLMLLGFAGAAASLSAQQARNTTSRPAATRAVAAPNSDDKRAMTVADYALWRSVRDVALSSDGTWASTGISSGRSTTRFF